MATILSILFWLCVIAGVLALLGYLFGRAFALETKPDSIVFCSAEDDWRLGLTRHRPAHPLPGGATPVILCPGAALDASIFDAAPETSLAAFLAEHGYDAWLLDPRGRGRSRRSRGRDERRLNWSFDDYVELDLPAAIEAVCARTGAQQVQLIGFGLGGLVTLAMVATGGQHLKDRVSGMATLGTTACFRRQRGTFSARRLRLLRWLRLDFLARVLAPLVGRLYPPQLGALQNRDNIDATIYRRALVSAASAPSRAELQQYVEWLERDAFTGVQQGRDLRELLGGLPTPTLMVAGPRDEIAPVDMVEATFNLLGEEAEHALLVASRMHGMSTNYGHLDLLLGRGVHRDLHTHLLRWLDQHAGVEVKVDRPAPPEPREGQVKDTYGSPPYQPAPSPPTPAQKGYAPTPPSPEDVLLDELDEDDVDLVAGDVPRVPPQG